MRTVCVSGPLCACLCVCVCVPSEDVKLLPFYISSCRGPPGSRGVGGQRRHPPGTRANVPAYIYIYISSRPWAHLSRSWGGHILYRCCFILSMPPVILNIHTYFYSFFHVNNDVLHVGCFFTTQFAMTFPSKCVTHVGIRQGGMSPTREYLSR